jgi:hypothetical protein
MNINGFNNPIGRAQGGLRPNMPPNRAKPEQLARAALGQMCRAAQNSNPASLDHNFKSQGYGFLPTEGSRTAAGAPKIRYANVPPNPGQYNDIKLPSHGALPYSNIPEVPKVKSTYVELPSKPELQYTNIPELPYSNIPEDPKVKSTYVELPTKPNLQYTSLPRELNYTTLPQESGYPSIPTSALRTNTPELKFKEYKTDAPIPDGMKVINLDGKKYLMPQDWELETKPQENSGVPKKSIGRRIATLFNSIFRK